MIRSPRRPCTTRRPSAPPRAEVAGGEPAVGDRAARCRRGRRAAASVREGGSRRRRRCHVDAVEGHPVVHDAAAGLGERHRSSPRCPAGPAGPRPRRARSTGTRRRRRGRARWPRVTRASRRPPRRRPRRRRRSRGARSGRCRWRGPGSPRRARRRGRAAGRRASGRRRSTPRRVLVASADARTASWVSTTPLGSPVDPLVATTSASPASTADRPPATSGARRRPRPISADGAMAASRRSRAGAGSRWSTGNAASPRSHTRRSASTNAGPPGRSRAHARLSGRRVHGAHDGVLEPLDPRRTAAHAAGRGRAGRRRRRVRRRATARSRGGRSRCALVVSLALQVGVNYANDYSDGVRGTDDVRVGPVRLVASGAAAPGAVKRAAMASFAVAAAGGLVLAATTSWWLLAVGVASDRRGVGLHRRAASPTATSGSARCSCSRSSGWSPPSAPRTSPSRRSRR